MKNKLYLLIFLISVFSLVSCYDKGNDVLGDTSTIEIKNLEEVYNIFSYDKPLVLTPEVTTSRPGDKIEYMWTIYKNSKKEKLDTIATTKDLNYEVKLYSDKYTLNFHAINKSNSDLTAISVIELNVVTLYSEGFYLLKEVGGNTEIDLHLPDKRVLSNLLTQSVGHSFSGKPVSMGQYNTFAYREPTTKEIVAHKFITPISENELGMIRLEDMKIVRNHDNMFYGEAPVEKPMFFYPNVFTACYVSSVGHYNSYQNVKDDLLSTGEFGYPLFMEDGYDISFSTIMHDEGMIFFDTKNGRFIGVDYSSTFHVYPNTRPDKPEGENDYPSNGIEDTFLSMGANIFGDHTGYAIFESKDNSKRLIYSLDIKEMKAFKNGILSVKEVPSSLKFRNATWFAPNRATAKIIYFVSDNKIYAYDIISGEEELLNFEGLSSDEITYFDNIYFHFENDNNKKFDYIVIATYNNGKYKLSLYNHVGGRPIGAPVRVLEGDGKIKTLQYTSPLAGINYTTGKDLMKYSVTY